MLTLKSFN